MGWGFARTAGGALAGSLLVTISAAVILIAAGQPMLGYVLIMFLAPTVAAAWVAVRRRNPTPRYVIAAMLFSWLGFWAMYLLGDRPGAAIARTSRS